MRFVAELRGDGGGAGKAYITVEADADMRHQYQTACCKDADQLGLDAEDLGTGVSAVDDVSVAVDVTVEVLRRVCRMTAQIEPDRGPSIGDLRRFGDQRLGRGGRKRRTKQGKHLPDRGIECIARGRM